MPSWEEPFGRVVAEGMAAGVPVVATRCGGPAELIEDGLTGVPGDTSGARNVGGPNLAIVCRGGSTSSTRTRCPGQSPSCPS